jgi:ABC-type lipoprotein release transport system permease subunit
VLAVASALTVVLVLALEPVAASFASSAFQVPDVSLLHASVVPRLLVGELLVLALAGAYPTARAVRLDPLDVLEPRVA